MTSLIRPTPTFDAEKRRRWYAACLGAASATAMTSILLITAGQPTQADEALWVTALSIFMVWLFLFIFKFVAAYVIWYRPYNRRLRAIILSVIATLGVYGAFISAGIGYLLIVGEPIDFGEIASLFYEFNKDIYGIPYVAAAIVGWCFARPAPDVRDSF